MLNCSQKQLLRQKIRFYDFSIREKRGIAVDCFGNQLVIPSWTALRQNAYQTILMSPDFHLIQRVPSAYPDEANCIIRLFQKQHYVYDDGNLIFNLYGFLCFVKNQNDKWTTKQDLFEGCDDTEVEIDFSHYVIHHSYAHECLNIETDFFDFFVKIS